ncbi:serine O-acetyltransferase [Beijerinckia indica subsp. indica ATCC 9039]|uniref:Serine acetyltransferase n=2 Tax=Beijerinckia TaxID=532 RepID=B2ICH8_BEII9|nr:serine O-acetyltransferase [Beijerinckia indica subsp. indica ATCC 9039]
MHPCLGQPWRQGFSWGKIMNRQTMNHMTLISDSGVPAGHSDRPGLYDPLWNRLRQEAEEAFARERALAPLFVSSILNRTSFESAVAHRIAARLGNETVPAYLIAEIFAQATDDDPTIGEAFRADILAVLDRDPACARLIEPFLYFKGFHAIQTHRLAHWLWNHQRQDFALYIQSRSSDVFQTDINPAARFGKGIFLDHATGLVVGATASIDDDVSILQNVTLGGTGKERGDRHPKIRRGVMIGAGAKILGNIEIGSCSRIAAGSVVLRPVEPNTTVAGVPARQVGTAGCSEPARSMDQILSQLSYDSFDYTI